GTAETQGGWPLDELEAADEQQGGRDGQRRQPPGRGRSGLHVGDGDTRTLDDGGPEAVRVVGGGPPRGCVERDGNRGGRTIAGRTGQEVEGRLVAQPDTGTDLGERPRPLAGYGQQDRDDERADEQDRVRHQPDTDEQR